MNPDQRTPFLAATLESELNALPGGASRLREILTLHRYKLINLRHVVVLLQVAIDLRTGIAESEGKFDVTMAADPEPMLPDRIGVVVRYTQAGSSANEEDEAGATEQPPIDIYH